MKKKKETYFLQRGKFSFQLNPADPVLPTVEREGRGVQHITDLSGIRTVPATTRASGSLGGLTNHSTTAAMLQSVIKK